MLVVGSTTPAGRGGMVGSDPAAVQAQRQALNREAYFSIVKYIVLSGREGKDATILLGRLRKEEVLNIDAATSREAMMEGAKLKQQGGLAAAGSLQYGLSGAYGHGQDLASAPPSGNYGAGMPQQQAGPKAPKAKPQGGPGGGQAGGTPGGQPKPKAALKLQKPKFELPPYVGLAVQRWWESQTPSQGGSWYTAWVTDYDAPANLYTLTYSLGGESEEFEKVNLDDRSHPSFISPDCIKFGEPFDIREKAATSMAVQNSSVLQAYLTAGGGGPGGAAGGGAKAGGGGGAKAKKRKSDEAGGGGSMMY